MSEVADQPSREILAGRRALDGTSGLVFLDNLRWFDSARKWAFPIRLSLQLQNSEFVPANTDWYVTLDANYPLGIVKCFPAKEGGIVATFPHQNYNGTGDANLPWRSGDPCLDNVGHLSGLRLTEEPADPDSRLGWHVERLIAWIDQASRHRLLNPGDFYELPKYPQVCPATVVYAESPETFGKWKEIDDRVGLVDLRVLNSSKHSYLLVETFYSTKHAILLTNTWGTYAKAHAQHPGAAIWMLLSDPPVLAPWQAPMSWQELRIACQIRSVEIDKLLQPLSILLSDRGLHYLLLGFPIPEIVGKAPQQMSWQAIQLPPFNERLSKNFRRNALALWHCYRSTSLRDETKVLWLDSEDWSREQLRGRGHLVSELLDKNVLIIGAGALGSAFAELLVRSGIVNLAIVDQDALVAGNLVRHTLDMKDLGKRKADSLAERLNSLSPHARVEALPGQFSFERFESQDLYDKYEIVIDCTAENQTLSSLANIPWKEKHFIVSLSLSYRAKRLYFFHYYGQQFPGDRCLTMLKPWLSLQNEEETEPLPWEGVGCWHPLFPARADDIFFMAATAQRILESAYAEKSERGKLLVLERSLTDHGLPELRDVSNS